MIRELATPESRIDVDRNGSTVHPLDRTVILIAFLAFPLALIGEVDNVSLGSVAWLLILFVGGLAALVVPLALPTLRSMGPFIGFMAYGVATLVMTLDFIEGMQILAQYAAVGLAYIAGWRAMAADRRIIEKLRRLSLWLLPAGLIVFVKAGLDGRFSFGWLVGDVARPMVMMLSVLFLISTIGRPRRFTLWVWGGAMLIALASGGRMGIAVLGLMLILTPALRVGGKARLAMVGTGIVLLSLALQFDAIQDRLFVGREEGELTDIVTLEGNFNTAGRAENWPQIVEACSEGATFGNGAGSSAIVSFQATGGRTEHPHNDYIRIWCEFGLPGSALFWGFFLLVGVRGWHLYRNRNASSIEAEIGALGALAVLAMLLFAMTDNVVTYTATFMTAAGVIWGISDRTYRDVSVAGSWMRPAPGPAQAYESR